MDTSRGQLTGKCVTACITGNAPIITALEGKVLKSMVGHLSECKTQIMKKAQLYVCVCVCVCLYVLCMMS